MGFMRRTSSSLINIPKLKCQWPRLVCRIATLLLSGARQKPGCESTDLHFGTNGC